MKITYDDRRHAYFLDGKRCKSVTAVAKIPDDTFSLNQWRSRQVAIGLASSPELVERVAAHFDDKDMLNRIAEEALQAAKAHVAAGRGTAWHRITERVDLGQDIIETPTSRKIRDAWLRALDVAGLEIDPEYVERIVVYPARLLAGKFDRLVRRKTDGRYAVLDLKTGTNAVRYPHSIAIQIALYAGAPLMAAPLPAASGSTETFGELPEMDRTLGYVVHMPEPEQVEIVGVDIEAGWHAAERICFETLEWRKRSDLIFPLPASSPPTKQDRKLARVTIEQPGTPANHAVPAECRYSWLRARLQAIAAKDDISGAMAEVAENWPAGVPTLKTFQHDDAGLDAITALLDRIEAKHVLPFGSGLSDFVPAFDPAAKIVDAFPGSVVLAAETP